MDEFQKVKKFLRQWESEFFQEHKRRPSKVSSLFHGCTDVWTTNHLGDIRLGDIRVGLGLGYVVSKTSGARVSGAISKDHKYGHV